MGAAPPRAVTFFVPVKLVSEANVREHWGGRNRRRQVQADAVAVSFYVACKGRRPWSLAMPKNVTFTVYGPKRLDSDNGVSSLKACRDALEGLIVDSDGNPAHQFHYAPMVVTRERRGVEIRVEVQP